MRNQRELICIEYYSTPVKVLGISIRIESRIKSLRLYGNIRRKVDNFSVVTKMNLPQLFYT